MIECFLATLSSYREVVSQAQLLLGHSRSHESIRHSVLTEARLLIRQQKKRFSQTENLALPEKEVPATSYLEADGAWIKLQKPEKAKKLEVKVDIGLPGKEDRYGSSSLKRLKEKFVYTGTGKDFLYSFILKVEEEMSVSQPAKLYFGGDGDNWITSGIRNHTSPMPPISYAVSI